MVDRARVVETVQIGLEATPGTEVDASRTLRTLSIGTKIPSQADMYRPDGHKFPSIAENNMEWTGLELGGRGSYTEICWPLAMMLGNPAPASSGTGIKTRVYTMSDTAILTPKTATIEKGSSVRAQLITYGLLTDLGMNISRARGAEMTGSGIGQLFQDGITKTASPTDVPDAPMMGKHFDIYIDAAAEDLGTTKMLRAFAANPSLGGVFGPIWPINSANASFAGHVDLAPTSGFGLTLEQDAAGMAYLADFRAGSTIFVRLEAIGPEFEEDGNYSFRWDAALKVKGVTPDEDESGLTVVRFDTEFTKDSTWGKAFEITVVNDIATVA